MKKLLAVLLFLCSPIILVVLAYYVIAHIFFGPPPAIAEADRESVFQQQQHESIQYSEVERTPEQAGEVRVIVIDPKNNNSHDLTALGKQLNADTGKDSQATIAVFDDEQAASNYDASTKHQLITDDQTSFDKHFIARFTKQSGLSKFELLSNGDASKPTKTTTYR